MATSPKMKKLVASMLALSLVQPVTASDLDIYAGNQIGDVYVMMMFDTSGSMSIDHLRQLFDKDRASGNQSNLNFRLQQESCLFADGVSYKVLSNNPLNPARPVKISKNTTEGTAYTATGAQPGSTNYFSDSVAYDRWLCPGSDNKYYVDRITALKEAINKVMDDNTVATGTNRVYVGIGQYSSPDTTAGLGGDGRTGRIVVPIARLDPAQRQLIKNAVNIGYDNNGNLLAGGQGFVGAAGTPTAHAYAEVASYMLESGTENDITVSRRITGMAKRGSSVRVTTENNRKIYTSSVPRENRECTAKAIYFLTDGVPNGSTNDDATAIMRASLNDSRFSCPAYGTAGSLEQGSDDKSAWNCIGEFAKRLNETRKIQTAVVGFGSSFANCNTAQGDSRNACRWGNEFGGGGFTNGKNAADVVASIKNILKLEPIGFTPNGMGVIAIPRDPLNINNVSRYGYFPMVQPMADNRTNVWPGNLKKYDIANGTIGVDTNGNKLIDPTEQLFNFNTAGVQSPNNIYDLWERNPGSNADHTLTTVGGTLDNIPVPTVAAASVARPVFVTDASGVLRQVTKANLATTDATFSNLTVKQRYYLLNYLGHNVDIPAQMPTALDTSQIMVPASPYRFLGGVIHSTPTLVTKRLSVDSTGQRLNTGNEEYLVYGSMEGGLHVVNVADGTERIAFVPSVMLQDSDPSGVIDRYGQVEALKENSAAIGLVPKYGVDAPWVADNELKLNLNTTSGSTSVNYNAASMNVYGGLRMGGEGLYGLDILNITSPRLKFTINRTSTGYAQLRQVWSRPVVAKIRYQGQVKKVLIFGGGYDPTVYENKDFVNYAASSAGNALYIADAENGSLLWSVSASNTASTGNFLRQTDVRFSVVGEPSARDANNDGLTDNIYFADLGGQVFRVDINNEAQRASTTTTAYPSLAVRVATLAQLGPDAFASRTSASYVPRFYERVVTTVQADGTDRFIMVLLGAGNRSYPLAKENRTNRVYGLIDRDATNAEVNQANFAPVAPITEADLASGKLARANTVQISDSDGNLLRYRTTASGGTVTTTAPTKRGWMFAVLGNNDSPAGTDAFNTGGYAKAMDESLAISNQYYVGVFDPSENQGGAAETCGAGLKGSTTRYRVCLPYGNCAAYSNGTVQGINGVQLGGLDTSNVAEQRITSVNPNPDVTCVGPGCGSSSADPNVPSNRDYRFSPSWVISPKRWYEWIV